MITNVVNVCLSIRFTPVTHGIKEKKKKKEEKKELSKCEKKKTESTS